jgi:hypothetical protein
MRSGMLRVLAYSRIVTAWIDRVVVIAQGRHGLVQHGLTTFGNQFINPFEIIL